MYVYQHGGIQNSTRVDDAPQQGMHLAYPASAADRPTNRPSREARGRLIGGVWGGGVFPG
jgi:hypothetical protein